MSLQPRKRGAGYASRVAKMRCRPGRMWVGFNAEVLPMAMKEALEAAMHSGSARRLSALQANGAALATEDTMTQAVHDVYCGIMADHRAPEREGSRAGPPAHRGARQGNRSLTRRGARLRPGQAERRPGRTA